MLVKPKRRSSRFPSGPSTSSPSAGVPAWAASCHRGRPRRRTTARTAGRSSGPGCRPPCCGLDQETVAHVDVRTAAPQVRLPLPRLGDASQSQALSLVEHLGVHVLHLHLVVPRMVRRDLARHLCVLKVRLEQLGVVSDQVASTAERVRIELLSLAQRDELAVGIPLGAVRGGARCSRRPCRDWSAARWRSER